MGGVKRKGGGGGQEWRGLEGRGVRKVCFPFRCICAQSLTQFKDDEQAMLFFLFFSSSFSFSGGGVVGGGGSWCVGVIWCFVTVCLRQETVVGRAALDNGMLGVMRVGKKMKRVLAFDRSQFVFSRSCQ